MSKTDLAKYEAPDLNPAVRSLQYVLSGEALPDDLATCEALLKDVDEAAWRLKAAVLRHIRDTRLYQAKGYATFEEYAQKVHGQTDDNLRRTIRDLAVVEALEESNWTSDISRGATRELSPTLREAGAEAVVKVVEEVAAKNGGRVTAKAIREHVAGTAVREGKDHAEERDELLSAAGRARSAMAEVLSAVGRPGFRHTVDLGQDLDSLVTILESQVRDLRWSLAHDFGVGVLDIDMEND